MAVDFPASPTSGQKFTSGGITWTYDGVKWTMGGSSPIFFGDSPPDNPSSGELWWDTVSAQLFIWYVDSNSAQWVVTLNMGTAGPQGVPGPQGEVGPIGPVGPQGPVGGIAGGIVDGLLTLEGADLNMGQLNVSDPVGDFGSYITGTKAGLYRWQIALGNGAPETGDGVGSDFQITLWNDDLSATFVPFYITRATGDVTMENNLYVSEGIQTHGWSTYFQAPGWIGQASSGSFMVQDAGVGNNAFITFHNAGEFAGNFGLSGSRLYMGGWSWGSGVVYQMWCSADFANPACDYRIKEDIAPLASTWNHVKALKPISYRQREYSPPNAPESRVAIIEADDRERWGFIAHELQETLGETAAHCPKDDPDRLQAPNLMMVVAALTKTVQEMQARIEVLEARR